jgi:azurin
MKYNKDLFRVKAGEPVELSFKNAGTMPKESMGHNVVILKPGVDLPTFGAEAAAAAADEYIPKSALSSIVSHTKLLGPGETDKITLHLKKEFIRLFVASLVTMVSCKEKLLQNNE